MTPDTCCFVALGAGRPFPQAAADRQVVVWLVWINMASRGHIWAKQVGAVVMIGRTIKVVWRA